MQYIYTMLRTFSLEVSQQVKVQFNCITVGTLNLKKVHVGSFALYERHKKIQMSYLSKFNQKGL